ncbi:MAG: hypothetical protein ABIK92_04170 [Pseudomonadota bacterium]
MKTFKLVLSLSMLLVFTGCFNHYIAKDYQQYLINNEGNNSFPKTSLEAQYKLTENTKTHSYKFRAASAGLAHAWIVEFGKVLEDTLESRDVQNAFGKLVKASGDNTQGNLLVFDLIEYRFENFRTFVTLKITRIDNSKTVSEKTYTAEGKSQGGKVFLGGVFTMKNAVDQSTKLAIDDILTSFINDQIGS